MKKTENGYDDQTCLKKIYNLSKLLQNGNKNHAIKRLLSRHWHSLKIGNFINKCALFQRNKTYH